MSNTNKTVTIGVTGATGNIGGAVARSLVEARRGDDAALSMRLIVRDSSRAPVFEGSNADVTVVTAAYGDRESGIRALEGVDLLFMVSAAESPDRVEEHVQFVQSALEAGVSHIVYTSFTGAGPEAGFTLARDHGATERVIKASGIDFTFLRDNFYLDVLPLWAGEDGVIRGPAGDGVIAAVARADVVDSAVAVLQHPERHRNAVYELTGGEALTFADVARRTSLVTGRNLRFESETVEEAYASRAHYGAPGFIVDAWVSTYTGIQNGELAAVSDDVVVLTGHPQRTLEDVLSEEVIL